MVPIPLADFSFLTDMPWIAERAETERLLFFFCLFRGIIFVIHSFFYFFDFVEFIFIVYLNCFIAIVTFELWHHLNDRIHFEGNHSAHEKCVQIFRKKNKLRHITMRMSIIREIWYESNDCLYLIRLRKRLWIIKYYGFDHVWYVKSGKWSL